MNDFFDTGVIIGTSYVKNISYTGIKSTDIDSNSIISSERYDKNITKIICNSVEYELRYILKRRKCMHRILLYELIDSPLKSDEYQKLQEYYTLAFQSHAKKRDDKWIKNMIIKLGEYDAEDVHHDIETIRILFELNIRNILKEVSIFRPSEKQKESREFIKNCISSLPRKPNHKDIVILSNAILYHNNEVSVTFVSVDKGFSQLNLADLKTCLQNLTPSLNCPVIDVINN